MRNLESYGVHELSAKQIRETEGGGFFTILAIFGVVTIVGSLILSNKSKNCSDDPNCTLGGGGGEMSTSSEKMR